MKTNRFNMNNSKKAFKKEVVSSYMSAEELKSKLYNHFHKNGALNGLRTQLRNQLVTELFNATGQQSKKTQNTDPKDEIKKTLLPLQVSNWLVYDHLQREGYEYSLSTFVSEANISSPDQLLTISDILDLLGLDRQSAYYNNISKSYLENNKESFLHSLLLTVIKYHTLHNSNISNEQVSTKNTAMLPDEMQNPGKSERVSLIKESFPEKQQQISGLSENRRILENSETADFYVSTDDREYTVYQQLQFEKDKHDREIQKLRQKLLQEVNTLYEHEQQVRLEMEQRKSKLAREQDILQLEKEKLKTRELELQQRIANLDIEVMSKMKESSEDILSYREKKAELKDWENNLKKQQQSVDKDKILIESQKTETEETGAKLQKVEDSLKSIQNKHSALLQENASLVRKLDAVSDYSAIKEELNAKIKEVQCCEEAMIQIKAKAEAENQKLQNKISELELQQNQSSQKLSVQEESSYTADTRKLQESVWKQQRERLEQELKEAKELYHTVILRTEEQREDIQELHRTIHILQYQLGETKQMAENAVKGKEQLGHSRRTTPKHTPVHSKKEIDETRKPSTSLPANISLHTRQPALYYPPAYVRNSYKDEPLKFIAEAKRRIDDLQEEAQTLENKYCAFLSTQSKLFTGNSVPYEVTKNYSFNPQKVVGEFQNYANLLPHFTNSHSSFVGYQHQPSLFIQSEAANVNEQLNLSTFATKLHGGIRTDNNIVTSTPEKFTVSNTHFQTVTDKSKGGNFALGNERQIYSSSVNFQNKYFTSSEKMVELNKESGIRGNHDEMLQLYHLRLKNDLEKLQNSASVKENALTSDDKGDLASGKLHFSNSEFMEMSKASAAKTLNDPLKSNFDSLASKVACPSTFIQPDSLKSSNPVSIAPSIEETKHQQPLQSSSNTLLYKPKLNETAEQTMQSVDHLKAVSSSSTGIQPQLSVHRDKLGETNFKKPEDQICTELNSPNESFQTSHMQEKQKNWPEGSVFSDKPEISSSEKVYGSTDSVSEKPIQFHESLDHKTSISKVQSVDNVEKVENKDQIGETVEAQSICLIPQNTDGNSNLEKENEPPEPSAENRRVIPSAADNRRISVDLDAVWKQKVPSTTKIFHIPRALPVLKLESVNTQTSQVETSAPVAESSSSSNNATEVTETAEGKKQKTNCLEAEPHPSKNSFNVDDGAKLEIENEDLDDIVKPIVLSDSNSDHPLGIKEQKSLLPKMLDPSKYNTIDLHTLREKENKNILGASEKESKNHQDITMVIKITELENQKMLPNEISVIANCTHQTSENKVDNTQDPIEVSYAIKDASAEIGFLKQSDVQVDTSENIEYNTQTVALSQVSNVMNLQEDKTEEKTEIQPHLDSSLKLENDEKSLSNVKSDKELQNSAKSDQEGQSELSENAPNELSDFNLSAGSEQLEQFKEEESDW